MSRFLTSHPTRLGYTVPFTSVGTRWKIQDRRQIKNRHTTKTKRADNLKVASLTFGNNYTLWPTSLHWIG